MELQMPRDGKMLVIIDNLEDFSDKLLSLISDESKDGCARLIGMLEQAKKNYNKPVDSWLKGWFYRFSKVRGPQVDRAIKGMEAFPDAYTRLQEFKDLVTIGEWNIDSSYNPYLFAELIKAIPGYQPLKNDEVYPVIIRLKDLIAIRIDNFMSQYKVNQKLMEVREKERLQTHQTTQKSIEHVQVFNNLATAKELAMTQQTKPVFYLTLKDKIWDLSWVDLKGKVYKLEPSEELIRLLLDQNVNDVETLNVVYMKRLKRECVTTREMFLDKTKVLINPKDLVTHAPLTNTNLISNGINTVFVLRGKPPEYTLTWINTLSQIKEIPLKQYPDLKEWLNTLDTITEENMPQLKSYLLHVNTKKSLGMGEFKRDLTRILEIQLGTKQSQQPIPEAAPKVEVKHNRLDMSLFSEVTKHFDSRVAKKENSGSEQETKKSSEKVEPGRLKIDAFAVAGLFGHKSPVEKAPDSVSTPECINLQS